MGPKVTYMGPKLTYMGPKLTYMGLKLTHTGPKLTYMDLVRWVTYLYDDCQLLSLISGE